MKKLFVVFLAMFLASGISMAQNGTKKKRVLPQNYGRVVINNYSFSEHRPWTDVIPSIPNSRINNHSERGQLAPVVYDHWLHRAKYTCRLCHVDIGFAMTANATGIRALDNIKGDYCGSCHNGKMTYEGEKIFGACSNKPNPEDAPRCRRCHSLDEKVKMKYEFAEYTGKFPKERFGNGIDWMKTESEGLIKLTDRLEGISMKRSSFDNFRDLTIVPNAKGMPDIIFSHDKHSVWNGCEVCHPDLFPSVRKGEHATFSMNEIFEDKYCGVCHGTVSFPLTECQRCHSKPVVNK